MVRNAVATGLAVAWFPVAFVIACQPAAEGPPSVSVPVGSGSPNPPVASSAAPEPTTPPLAASNLPEYVRTALASFGRLPRCTLTGSEMSVEQAVNHTALPSSRMAIRGHLIVGSHWCTEKACKNVDSAGHVTDAECCNNCGGGWSLAMMGESTQVGVWPRGDNHPLSWGALDCHIKDLAGAVGGGIEVVATGTVSKSQDPMRPFVVNDAEVCVVR